ncbi:hypothetical protein MNB_SM-3-1498 [hydrothermal vent metagenome]|uniref:DUF4194 domain-containing protein n=1 Tax=hydrothermal vent metagenome TaxID=652676 RepID=A0A1W1D2N7_9ZZZZ
MIINTEELAPQHIKKIYQMILKGEFINENSSKNGMNALYEAISVQENELRAYFRVIGYELLCRDGYYYFAHDEASTAKSVLEQMVDYIDIVNFLKVIDPNFGVGYRFTLSSLEMQLNSNIELQNLAKKMKWVKAKDNREFIQKIIEKLKKDGFIEDIDNTKSKYIVLNCYEYIETFFNEVEIYE